MQYSYQNKAVDNMVLLEHTFLVFYTAFISFIIVVSGLSAIPILTEGGFFVPTDSGFNFVNILANFLTLLIVGVVPEFTLIFTLIIVPYLIAVAYIIWKALPFT